MKCLYIFNPVSGKKKALKNKVKILQTLKQQFEIVDEIATSFAEHAYQLALTSCGKYDVLVVAGGDGTLSEVINAIACKPNAPILGYIPLGTVNDFAHSCKIPRSIKGALKVIAGGNYKDHDVFKVDQFYGIYVCALGIFTTSSYHASQTSKNALGKIAYFIDGAKSIFSTKTQPAKITANGKVYSSPLALMIATNSRYVAGFKVNKKFTPNDGFVELVWVEENRPKVSFGRVLRIFRLFLFGISKKQKHVTHLKVNSFHFEAPEKTNINIDGEQKALQSFNFSVIKSGIKIFMP